MYPSQTLEQYLAQFKTELRDIITGLRDIVAAVVPDATEEIHAKGITYYVKARGGPVSAGICQIGIQRDHIRLEFIHGAFLPDPKGLLRAEGKRKYKRYVRVDSYEQAPWEDLEALIQAAAKFDPYSLLAS